MGRLIVGVVAATLISSSAQAADWRAQAADARTGVFVGARMALPLGGTGNARSRASLGIAPTMRNVSANGEVSTRIGEGVALNFGPQSKPTLTLAGVRADIALGLQRNGNPDTGQQLGLSDGGKIALGLGIAALIAGGLYLAADRIADCDEGECD